MAWGHSFASASARPSGMPSPPPHACSHAPPTRRCDIMLTQTNTPKPSAEGRTSFTILSQIHLLCVVHRVVCQLVTSFEAVRRWLGGIHLLQRLRVPPGFPRLPRKPKVLLLQLGAPTLCLRKRTPQSHLLWFGRSLAPPTRRSDIMLMQMNTPKPSAVCRTLFVSVSWFVF